MAYRKEQGLVEDFFGIGLTSRKNLCLNPVVAKEKKGKVVDSKCRNLTASWVRAKAGKTKGAVQNGDDPMELDEQVQLCNFYEVDFFYTCTSIKLNIHIKMHFIYIRHWNLLILPILFPMVYIP